MIIKTVAHFITIAHAGDNWNDDVNTIHDKGDTIAGMLAMTPDATALTTTTKERQQQEQYTEEILWSFDVKTATPGWSRIFVWSSDKARLSCAPTSSKLDPNSIPHKKTKVPIATNSATTPSVFRAWGGNKLLGKLTKQFHYSRRFCQHLNADVRPCFVGHYTFQEPELVSLFLVRHRLAEELVYAWHLCCSATCEGLQTIHVCPTNKTSLNDTWNGGIQAIRKCIDCTTQSKSVGTRERSRVQNLGDLYPWKWATHMNRSCGDSAAARRHVT